MTRMDAKYQKDRRDRIKREKDEIRKMTRIRVAESRARRRSSTEIHHTDVAKVEEKGEMEEDTLRGAPPDATRVCQ